jgi:protein-disulfide isomerase-like protein with CxxC motif
MGEAKVGDEFVTHEFDEAIAIQQVIVDAETTLSTRHPVASTKRVISAALTDDRAFLKQLKAMGKEHGATGKVEDVAEGLKELMESTLESATKEGHDSEFYEAHAVLLTTIRKQMDSAAAMRKIGSDAGDTKLRDAAATMQKALTASAKALSAELAAYAVHIANETTPSKAASTR